MKFLSELEKHGKALIFRPTEKPDSFQSDVTELERCRKTGCDMCIGNKEKLFEFIKE